VGYLQHKGKNVKHDILTWQRFYCLPRVETRKYSNLKSHLMSKFDCFCCTCKLTLYIYSPFLLIFKPQISISNGSIHRNHCIHIEREHEPPEPCMHCHCHACTASQCIACTGSFDMGLTSADGQKLKHFKWTENSIPIITVKI
jgi:hypothetical protein